MIWNVKRSKIDVSRGRVLMGIINATPDSFSDGGKYASVEDAVQNALRLEKEGAAIIDVGGESTRPGSDSVSDDEEISRVVPVIRCIREKSDILISIDTRHPAVAEASLDAGADIINDVEGFRDDRMIELAVKYQCGAVIMPMQGMPKTMQHEPSYEDVIEDVRQFFQDTYARCIKRGMNVDQICWDPGIGFGKTLEHNLDLIRHMKELQVEGRPILLGLSRKRMLGAFIGNQDEAKGPVPTAVMTVLGHQYGAQIHRVHDVKACKAALDLEKALTFR